MEEGLRAGQHARPGRTEGRAGEEGNAENSSTVRVEWAEDAHDKPQIIDPNDDLPDDVPCGSMVYIRPQVIALDGA